MQRRAAELMAELQKDPEYRARMQRREQQQRENTESYDKAAARVLKDLGAIGYRVNTVGELRHGRRNYRSAIPTLLRWLPRISDRHYPHALGTLGETGSGTGLRR